MLNKLSNTDKNLNNINKAWIHLLSSTANELNKLLLSINTGANVDTVIATSLNILKLEQLDCEKLISENMEVTNFVEIEINKLLNKYPFKNNEKDYIQVEIPDDFFALKCAPIFVESLFFNLLSNALRSIEQAGKGKINIWVENNKEFYILHFKDTAQGMDKHALATVFDQLYSWQMGELKPGLCICRLALTVAGADLSCDSIKGEYTDFKIKVPK